MDEGQEVCPHCGAVRDVLRVVEGDEASIAAAHPHRPNVPAVEAKPRENE